MGYRQSSKRKNHHSGFTLMEIVLVLVVMVLITSIAWPLLINTLSYRQLTSAAEEIKASWVQARVDAMQKNVILQFYYQEDTGTYWTQAYNPDEYLASTEASQDAEQEDLPELSQSNSSGPNQRTLQYKIKFTNMQQDDDQRAEVLLEDAESSASSSSSEPAIWFYPDGRTSTAIITLTHPDNLQVSIRLRGLTGIATIDEMEESSEGSLQ